MYNAWLAHMIEPLIVGQWTILICSKLIWNIYCAKVNDFGVFAFREKGSGICRTSTIYVDNIKCCPIVILNLIIYVKIVHVIVNNWKRFSNTINNSPLACYTQKSQRAKFLLVDVLKFRLY